jgi:hypothetical protein
MRRNRFGSLAAFLGASAVFTLTLLALGGTAHAQGHILDGNTTALWRLNEAAASANAADETAHYTLTQYGSPDVVSGPAGTGRQLNGTTKFFQRAGDASFGAVMNGDWTYEGWVFLDPSFSGWGNLFIYNGLNFSSNPADTILSEVGISPDKRIYWHQWRTTSAYTEVRSNVVLQTGRYYHVAISRAAQGGNLFTYRIYVNGALDKTTQGVAGSSGVSGASHYIGLGNYTTNGGLGFGGNRLNGRLDDTRISSVSRTTAEIFESYRRGSTTLGVAATGTGSGTVRSQVAGIDCGADCTETLAYGTVVTLNATPAAGSYFNGWSGDACAGNVSLTCLVPLDKPTTVGADFTTTAPAVPTWARTFGTAVLDHAQSVQQTSDGGYVAAGMVSSYEQIWVVKLDAAGTVAWQKTYAGGGATSIQQTADGGYIVLGLYWSLLKLAADGSVAWQNLYGFSGTSRSVQQTSDGGYILAGWEDIDDEALAVKVRADGTVAWQNTYGGISGEEFASAQQTADGGYVAAGYTCSFGVTNCDAWVVKLDEAGAVSWSRTYGDSGAEWANSVRQTSDGGYIVGGKTESGERYYGNGWLLKLAADGSVVWEKTYNSGASFSTEEIFSVREVPDGGYLAVGTYLSFNAMILKTTPDGTPKWLRSYLRLHSGGDFGFDIQPAADGGSIVAGTTGGAYASFDASVLKLDASGTFADCGGEPAQAVSATVASLGVTSVSRTPTVVAIAASPAAGAPVATDFGSSTDACISIRHLTILRTGNGSGTVSDNEGAISCGATCAAFLNDGTNVTLTAAPAPDATFTGWSGGGCSGTGECVVTMDADTEVTATFTSSKLTVAWNGTGAGVVSGSVGDISCGRSCTDLFPVGATVTLTATPYPGSTFAGWEGGGCSGTGTCTVTLLGDLSVLANFSNSNLFAHETFDDGLPDGWTVVDNVGDGEEWRFNDPGERFNQTGGSAGFAIADSDYWANVHDWNAMDTELVSPVYDLTALPFVVLEFKTDFAVSDNAQNYGIAEVDVSVDCGLSAFPIWTTVPRARRRTSRPHLAGRRARKRLRPLPLSRCLLRQLVAGGRLQALRSRPLCSARRCRRCPGPVLYDGRERRLVPAVGSDARRRRRRTERTDRQRSVVLDGDLGHGAGAAFVFLESLLRGRL